MIDPAQAATETPTTSIGLIDCDIHNNVPNVRALFPYLSAHWREHIEQTLFKGATDTIYPRGSPITNRPGSVPEGDTVGCPNVNVLRSQVLDPLGVDFGILCCSYGIDGIHHPDAAVALAQAVNDWQIAEWLERDSRLRASIVVPSQIPALAAAEIDRVGDHPGFVQVYLPVRSQHPYGSRIYQPLWEAIARHNLVGGLHFGGSPGNPPTPSGWPSYFFEEYAGMAQVFQSQLVNIISEGVFDLFPNVKIALLESGFTWLPPFMWRFDKEWRNLRRTVPWVKRAPSSYIREHVRISIAPLDLPPNPVQLLQVIEQCGSEDVLLYASDFPHVHRHDPLTGWLRDVPQTLARKIRAENARALYELGTRGLGNGGCGA
jgi:predicted TIM-barrel fold metal-dependent hydrolase